LTTARETSDEEMRTADLARVSPTGDQMPVAAETPRAAVSGEAQRGEIATDAPAPATLARGTATQGPAAQSASARAPRTRLPATATATPAILLAGLLALTAAFGLGVWRRNRT
jgi:LPXTG-motif cell wall-anchored protein